MTIQKNSAGFEYRNKKDETPFETFLRYTDEKEKSAAQLANILQDKVGEGAKILDIGTGNGEYLDLALSQLEDLRNVQLTLVEPSDDLVKQLETRFKKLVPPSNLKVVQSNLEDLATNESFDVILMSHLFYHVPRASWTEQLAKALSFLKSGGVLLVVLREKDDAYAFKMAFKPILFHNPSFRALVIDDVLDALPVNESIEVTKHSVASELQIPLEQNVDDAIAIIEFYLNKQWEEIPKSIQQEAFAFIKGRGGTFKQLDCIAAVTKT